MMRLLWVASFACLVGCGSPSEVEPPPQAAQGGSSAGVAAAAGGAAAGGGGVSAGGAAAGSANSGGSAGDSAGQGGSGAPVAGSGGGAGGSSAGAGGQSGSGTANGPYPTAPPVRDSASKVPISNAGAGYTVEGNHAYGPLTAQRLDVIYPNDAGPNGTAILPVVLMFHGGAWIHSYTNNYGSGKDHMSTFFSRFLKHGFIVCNAEYRVNDGTADGAVAPAAVEDALLAAKWCWDYMDYFHGDRSKFVVTGASAGGHLALMVGMTTPAAMLGPTSPADFKIAAIVDGYGPADIEAELDAVAKGWIPTNLPNRAAIAKLVNPITYVSANVPPMIAVTGANDNTAPVRDTQRLVDLLKAAGADASIHLVPGEAHGYTSTANGWNNAEKAMFDWLTARGIGK
jgi:acetyl esterase/lipase